MNPFAVKDCALIVQMGDQPPAMNLRELREGLARCSPEALTHHFFETLLRPSFDDPEYRNDVAVWAKRHLHDSPLSERLGLINAYDYTDVEELRADVLDMLDERLAEVSMVPWVRPGEEFRFQRAVTMVFNTHLRIRRLAELPRILGRMTPSSLYYHFLAARRREPLGQDDFSAWVLEETGPLGPRVAERLGRIDFHFLTLAELKKILQRTVAEALAETEDRP